MIQYCPECKAKLDIHPSTFNTEVDCPKCHGTFTPRPVAPLAKRKAKVKPTKDHSIYAWFVGLPCGVLLLAMSLAVIFPIGCFSYYTYMAHQRAEQLALEEASRRRQEQDLQERLLHEKAEQQRQEQERAFQLAQQDKQLKVQHEREEAVRQVELEKQRLQSQERMAREQAALEKERLAKQERDQQQQLAQAEVERLRREKQAAIDQDHGEILDYTKKNMPAFKNAKHIHWESPLPATTLDGKQEGILYGLRGDIRRVNATTFKAETVFLQYYFLIQNRKVLDYENVMGASSMTKFKAK
jgi:hypothetical protein